MQRDWDYIKKRTSLVFVNGWCADSPEDICAGRITRIKDVMLGRELVQFTPYYHKSVDITRADNINYENSFIDTNTRWALENKSE